MEMTEQKLEMLLLLKLEESTIDTLVKKITDLLFPDEVEKEEKGVSIMKLVELLSFKKEEVSQLVSEIKQTKFAEAFLKEPALEQQKRMILQITEESKRPPLFVVYSILNKAIEKDQYPVMVHLLMLLPLFEKLM